MVWFLERVTGARQIFFYFEIRGFSVSTMKIALVLERNVRER